VTEVMANGPDVSRRRR